jgi:DNA-binding phage protein
MGMQQHRSMLYAEASLARIRAYVSAKKVTGAMLARATGLCENTARKLTNPKFNPNFETLLALEQAVPADFMPLEWRAAGGEFAGSVAAE